MNLDFDTSVLAEEAIVGTQQRPAVIRVRDLVKRFPDQTIYNGLDLDVWKGEVLGIVGGSGTGKSVLLRCITGLEPTQSGTIEVFGENMSQADTQTRRQIESRWGVLFQDGALFGALSVLQNIQVPMCEHTTLTRAMMDELAHLKISMVGLPPSAAHKKPSELSGGMRKRAGLARALSLDPEIVFLDEPTAGLDPIGAAAFDHLIRRLQKTLGLTVYMVTHDLDSLFAICDRVAVLAEGRIFQTGSPQELQARPGHPWIRDYFQGERAKRLMPPTDVVN